MNNQTLFLVFMDLDFLVLEDPGAVSRVRKNGGESFQEQAKEPL